MPTAAAELSRGPFLNVAGVPRRESADSVRGLAGCGDVSGGGRRCGRAQAVQPRLAGGARLRRGLLRPGRVLVPGLGRAGLRRRPRGELCASAAGKVADRAGDPHLRIRPRRVADRARAGRHRDGRPGLRAGAPADRLGAGGRGGGDRPRSRSALDRAVAGRDAGHPQRLCRGGRGPVRGHGP